MKFFFLLMIPLKVFALKDCPKFSNKKYSCSIMEGESLIKQTGTFRVKKPVLGKKVLVFETKDYFVEIKLDGKVHRISDIKHRASCENKVLTVKAVGKDYFYEFSGDKKEAQVVGFYEGKRINKIICRR